jgi:hypothetical protein
MRPTFRRFLLAALFALALTGGVVAPAEATWLAPVDLSSEATGSAGYVQVAMDAHGDAVAVWEQFNGTNWIAQSSVRPAGTGTWSAPVDLSAEGEDISEPRVAVDAHGQAVAVWEARNGLGYVAQGSIRPAGGEWHSATRISAEGESIGSPQVAIDAHGDAIAVWEDTAEAVIKGAIHPAAAVVWGTAHRISGAGEAENPHVALDRRGDAVAVWEAWPAGADSSVIQANTRPVSAGKWQTPVELSVPGEEGANALYPQVAVDARGDATALWVHEDVITSASRSAATAAWGAPVHLSPGGSEVIAEGVGFAVAPHGSAIVVWAGGNGSTWSVESAARSTAGGAWGEPLNVTVAPEGTTTQDVSAALNPGGEAVAAWTMQTGHFTTLKDYVQSALRPAAGGAWGEPADLTETTENAHRPKVAIAPSGEAVAAWELLRKTLPTVVQSSFYEP